MIDYTHHQGVRYQPGRRSVWASLPVCQYLSGAPWDEIALAAVSSLRPSSIRVVPANGDVTDDGQTWRVSVYLKADGNIASIEQEVSCDVADDVKHGHDLTQRLSKLPSWEKPSWVQKP